VSGIEPASPLKAQTCFEDGDLPTLPPEVKRYPLAAVCAVKDLPDQPVPTTPLGAEI
jgi:hypothetical protein